jgi:hypothetical protein
MYRIITALVIWFVAIQFIVAFYNVFYMPFINKTFAAVSLCVFVFYYAAMTVVRESTFRQNMAWLARSVLNGICLMCVSVLILILRDLDYAPRLLIEFANFVAFFAHNVFMAAATVMSVYCPLMCTRALAQLQ